MSARSIGIYRAQRGYFQRAYETGVHGWPIEVVSAAVAAFLRRRRPKQRPRMLDIGCGEGRHTIAFARAGYHAVGLDREPKALERARGAIVKHGADAGCGLARADVFALPFRGETFDVVLDYGCLHHVRRSDTGRYLAQVAPLITPGGYFLLSCFSTKFQHDRGERRTRDWIVHHGHYDRFFRRADFHAIFGGVFDVLAITEDRDGLYVFFNVLMQKRGGSRAAASRSGR